MRDAVRTRPMDLPNYLSNIAIEFRALADMAQPIQQVVGGCLAPITDSGDELMQEDREFVEDDEQSGVGLRKRFFEHTLTLRRPVAGYLFPQLQLQLPDSQLIDVPENRIERIPKEMAGILTQFASLHCEIGDQVLRAAIILAIKPYGQETKPGLIEEFAHDTGFADPRTAWGGPIGLHMQGSRVINEETWRRTPVENISRRQFLGKSAIGITAAGYLAAAASKLSANPLAIPIGFQSWSVQQLLQRDFDGTLKDMAGFGFQSMELCSPPSYRQFGFGGLVNLKGSELRDKINSAGLKCESCHYQWGELKTSLDERIAYAKDLGLKQMILSTFGLPAKATLEDWKRNAEELNKMGEKANAAGIQLGFHNHDFEFQEIGGVLIYDELLKIFDPKLISCNSRWR